MNVRRAIMFLDSGIEKGMPCVVLFVYGGGVYSVSGCP